MAILRKDNSEIVQYASKETPVHVQKGALSDYPNYSEIAHWHNDIELIYVTHGAMQFNVNGDIVDLAQGQGLFINSRQLHSDFPTASNANLSAPSSILSCYHFRKR